MLSIFVYMSSFVQEMEVVWRMDEALDWGPEERNSSLDSSLGSVIMNKVPEQTEDQSSAPPATAQD